MACFRVAYGTARVHLYRFTISIQNSFSNAGSAARAKAAHESKGKTMTSKAKSKSGRATDKSDAAKPSNPNAMTLTQPDGKSRERLLAELGFSTLAANADTARTYAKGMAGELHFKDSVAVMREKAEQVQRGDLSEAEATLTAQAVTLDAIFNALARRAALNMGEYMGACETYLRLALKAQAQCRATLETLAEVKYPKAATFVRQQNVAYQQQVNNNAANKESTTPAHAHGKNTTSSNELIKEPANATLDARGTTAAIGVNSPLETVGAVNGRTDD